MRRTRFQRPTRPAAAHQQQQPQQQVRVTPPRDVVPRNFRPVVKVWLVRHGETNENRLGIVQGTMDTELNEEGIKQAQLVAEVLKAIPFDFTLTSDLKRASSASPLSPEFGYRLTVLCIPDS